MVLEVESSSMFLPGKCSNVELPFWPLALFLGILFPFFFFKVYFTAVSVLPTCMFVNPVTVRLSVEARKGHWVFWIWKLRMVNFRSKFERFKELVMCRVEGTVNEEMVYECIPVILTLGGLSQENHQEPTWVVHEF